MTTIITKNSSTASAVPLAADLVQGEIAVNVTDKKLYTKNASAAVVELGTTPSSVTTGAVSCTTLATTGNVTLGDASTDTLNVGNGGLVKDASGNVGVGTSSPTQRLSIAGSAVSLKLEDTSIAAHNVTSITANGAASTISWDADNVVSSSYLAFTGDGSEKMRIDSSGNMFIGTTSGAAKLNVAGDIDLRSTSNFIYTNNIGAVSSAASILVRNSTQGVQLTANATSWTSASDERLKTGLIPIENAVQKVISLRPVTGRYNNDEETVSRAFVIAQEVQQVFPEAVSEIEQDGERYLGLQYSDLIPLLTAAIQEQQALITTLTNRITALEQA